MNLNDLSSQSASVLEQAAANLMGGLPTLLGALTLLVAGVAAGGIVEKPDAASCGQGSSPRGATQDDARADTAVRGIPGFPPNAFPDRILGGVSVLPHRRHRSARAQGRVRSAGRGGGLPAARAGRPVDFRRRAVAQRTGAHHGKPRHGAHPYRARRAGGPNEPGGHDHRRPDPCRGPAGGQQHGGGAGGPVRLHVRRRRPGFRPGRPGNSGQHHRHALLQLRLSYR